MTNQNIPKNLKELETNALALVAQAKSAGELEKARVALLGKKSEIAISLKGLGKLPPSERPTVGAGLNRIRSTIEKALDEAISAVRLKELTEKLANEQFDITLPGRPAGMGKFHPVGAVMENLVDIFIQLGFTVEEGPEIETDERNFKMLNFPEDHPARDMQDTLYVQNGKRLLRTHTSPVQIHALTKHNPPISVIAPGRVYRRDSDVTHSPVFHQLEGFHVDRDVTFGNLKATLELFIHRLYGEDVQIRFRPSFFPFTEPSAEIDVSCVLCAGAGCRVCKQTGWLEILGAGMIDPNVLSAVGLDPEEWTGFAFGCGIERIAMLKYGISDIRLLFENDPRFLERF